MNPNPQTSPNLYFIAHDSGSDMDLDLLVWARAPQEALDFWRAYFEITGMDAEVMLVPTTDPKPGALAWHDPEGVRAVEAV